VRDGAALLALLACAVWVAGAAPAGADESASGAPASRVHVVRPGETLWQITAALTGDPHRWPQLYRANRDQIKDPSTLYPGQRLAIPDFDEPAADEPSGLSALSRAPAGADAAEADEPDGTAADGP